MELRVRIIIGIIIVLAFIYICHAIKTKYIDIRHSLIWMVVAIVLLILDLFPALLEKVTVLFGFALPVNMLFFLGFCLTIIIIFSLTAKVSKMSDQVKRLTQEMALLNKEFEEKKENEKESKTGI
jgi:hypothetical protein